MVKIVEFAFEADHERALEVLHEAGESFGGVAQSTISVSESAILLLSQEGVRFRVWGRGRDANEEYGGG